MEIILLVGAAMLTAYWVCAVIVAAARVSRIGSDETVGVQKLHHRAVPRLGGVAVFVALIAGLLSLAWATQFYKQQAAFLVVALLPAFGMGLVEDLTRRAGIVSRLVATMVSAGLGWWLFSAGLNRIGWDVADHYLATHAAAGFIMTMLAAAGSAQAVNIIDGCHGFSGFFVFAAMAALAVVAGMVGDSFVCFTAVLTASAVAGFLLWNFPRGKVFLGDAGAYMLGFLIAQLSMILMTRHPEMSPWCPMLIMAYPAWETLFSMYRRAHLGLREMGKPDARHLHQLVYFRVFKWQPEHGGREARDIRSAATSMALWPLMLMCIVPAVLFWKESHVLFWLCWLFAITYTVIYMAIVRFKVPPLIGNVLARRLPRARKPAAVLGGAQQVQN